MQQVAASKSRYEGHRSLPNHRCPSPLSELQISFLTLVKETLFVYYTLKLKKRRGK